MPTILQVAIYVKLGYSVTMEIAIDDKVRYTGNPQYLHGKGFLDDEINYLLHSYGTVAAIQGVSILVSFEALRVDPKPIVRVWLHQNVFEIVTTPVATPHPDSVKGMIYDMG